MVHLFYVLLATVFTTAQAGAPDPAFIGSGKYVTIFDDQGHYINGDVKYENLSKTFAVSVLGSVS